MAKEKHDCEILGYCPYDADGGYDCRNYCGIGVDENEPDDDYGELSYDPVERR